MSDTDTTPLSASKDAYSFDETTREYLGCVEVFLSPLEATYFLPRNVVVVAPPRSLDANTCARLNAEGTVWEVVPDFRRCMLWDTATCRPIPNGLALGDVPPAGATVEAPPILNSDALLINAWDSGTHTWHQLPDYSRTPVWAKDTGSRASSPPPREALPNTLTVIQPPHVGDHQAVRWNALHEQWDIVPDYRGLVYWTADNARHVIAEVGVIPPAGALTAPPSSPADDLSPVP